MKIFVSWSGDRSRRVAEVLCEWLPLVIQSVDPYMSSKDIDKGARWSSEISSELENSEFGVVCVTPENGSAPWLNFEAGALSNSYGKSKVAPFLIGLSPTDLTGPMVQFQATQFEESDVKKLVDSINGACGDNKLEVGVLEQVFETWWPKLAEKLQPIQDEKNADSEPQRADSDLLAEILENVRSQQRIMSNPAEILPPEYLQFAFEELESGRGHPALGELDDQWRRVRASLDNFENDQGDALRSSVKEVDPLVRYIVNRFWSSPKRRTNRLAHRPISRFDSGPSEPPQ